MEFYMKSHLAEHFRSFDWAIEGICPRNILLGAEYPLKSPSFKCGPAVLHLELCFLSGEIQLRVVQSNSDDSSWCTNYGIELRPFNMCPTRYKCSSAPIKFSNIALKFATKLFENSDVTSKITVGCLFDSMSLEHEAQCESETVAKTNKSETVAKTNESETEMTVHGNNMEQGLVSLSINMEHMLENSCFYDVTLKVGGDTLRAHKDVLACRSKVFKAMFESNMKEELENEVNLVEMKLATAKEMLKYIYTGKIQELSMDQAMDLYVSADRYDLQELRGWCKGFICKHISVEDVCKVAVLADLHSDKNLAQAAQRVFKEESKSVLATEGWRDFAKKNPNVYANLLECFIKLQ